MLRVGAYLFLEILETFFIFYYSFQAAWIRRDSRKVLDEASYSRKSAKIPVSVGVSTNHALSDIQREEITKFLHSKGVQMIEFYHLDFSESNETLSNQPIELLLVQGEQGFLSIPDFVPKKAFSHAEIDLIDEITQRVIECSLIRFACKEQRCGK
jgi:hypothetical protein